MAQLGYGSEEIDAVQRYAVMLQDYTYGHVAWSSRSSRYDHQLLRAPGCRKKNQFPSMYPEVLTPSQPLDDDHKTIGIAGPCTLGPPIATCSRLRSSEQTTSEIDSGLAAAGTARTLRRDLALGAVVAFYRVCGLIGCQIHAISVAEGVSQNTRVLRGLLRTATCGNVIASAAVAELAEMTICEVPGQGCLRLDAVRSPPRWPRRLRSG